MHFEQGKLMRVNYNPALVGLVQQVRQISVMGYNVPMHIQDAAELAKQFMKQARALQQASDIFIFSTYMYLFLFWDLICISSQKTKVQQYQMSYV